MKRLVIVIGVVVVFGLICGVLVASSMAHEQTVLSNHLSATPDSRASLMDWKLKSRGYTYALKYYSDALDTSNFKISGKSAELTRPGLGNNSYIMTLSTTDITKDCSDGKLIAPFQVTLASGTFSVCTNIKASALVMRFRDSQNDWHRAIFFASNLNSLNVKDPDFRAIFSSISVE